MQETDLFTAFCTEVLRHVRCRFVRKAIASELDAHMEDHAAALYAQGADVQEARRLAVEAMGDPKEVGEALDKLYPPILYWLARILGWAAAALFLSILILAALRTAEDEWHNYSLFSLQEAKLELEVRDWTDPIWMEQLVAQGTVTGGGSLGDYSFQPATEAWLVYLPAYSYKSAQFDAYYELRFTLSATHAQPWLDDLNLDFSRPTITDGAGSTVRYFDEPYRRFHAGVSRLTPFESTVNVTLEPVNPYERNYTFSITGPDGRMLEFVVALTDWEVVP